MKGWKYRSAIILFSVIFTLNSSGITIAAGVVEQEITDQAILLDDSDRTSDGGPAGDLEGEFAGGPAGDLEGEPAGDPAGDLDGESAGDPDNVLDDTPDGEPTGDSTDILDGEPVGDPDGVRDGDLDGKPDGEYEDDPEDEPGSPAWYDPEADTYEISTAEELAELAELSATESFTGKTIRLTRDIMGYQAAAPIGTEENPFTGTFDGLYHTIGFSTDMSSSGALFGLVQNAKITGLRLKDAWIKTEGTGVYMGALAVRIESSQIDTVWIEDAVIVSAFRYIGGMGGNVEDTVFSSCLVSGFTADKGGAYVGVTDSMSSSLRFSGCAAVGGAQPGITEIIQIGGWNSPNIQNSYSDTDFNNYNARFIKLNHKAFSDGEAAYRLSQSSAAVWGVENGLTAPLPFLSVNARIYTALMLRFPNELRGATAVVNGIAADSVSLDSHVVYCAQGEIVEVSIIPQEMPYEGAVNAACSSEDSLIHLNDGVWQYTASGNDDTITFYFSPTGGYDISWYAEGVSEFEISNVEQFLGLALLVSGAVGSEPVSFSGCTIYLTEDLVLPASFKPIGSEDTPFSGILTGLTPMEDEEEAAVDTAKTITLASAPLFQHLEKAEVSGICVDSMLPLSGPTLASTAVDTQFILCVNTAEIAASVNDIGGLVGIMAGGEMVDCRNLGSISATGNSYRFGGLIGSAQEVKVTGCVNKGSIENYYYGGGLIGSAVDCSLSSCVNSGRISNSYYAGGLVGKITGCVFVDSGNSGDVFASRSEAGGIAADVDGTKDSSLSDGFNEGNISSVHYVGGAFGYVSGTNQEFSAEGFINKGSVSATANYAGGIIGYMNQGTINNCTNEGIVTAAMDRAGGIIGYNYNNSVRDAINYGKVSATNYAGGIAGYSCYSGNITDVTNHGEVFAETMCAGGITGYSYSDSISRAENHGNVSAPYYAGGICGYINGATLGSCVNSAKNVYGEGGIVGQAISSTLTDCENRAAVNSNADAAGGICGLAENSVAENCRNQGNVTTAGQSAGGCFGKLTGSYEISLCKNAGNIQGGFYSSGIAYLGGGTVSASDCVNTGGISGAGLGAGMFVIPNYSLTYISVSGTITRCVNKGSVSADFVAGGITTYAYSVQISLCENSGAVTVESPGRDYSNTSKAGGIAAYSRARITSCLNTGDVSVSVGDYITDGAGGIIGYAEGSGGAVDCLNLGRVICPIAALAGEITGGGTHQNSQNIYCGPDGAANPSDGIAVIGLTSAQIASGEAAWLLNQGISGGWSQDIGRSIPVPVREGFLPVYRLSLSVGEGGTISLSDSQAIYATEGEQLDVTITPDEGMVVTLVRLAGVDPRYEKDLGIQTVSLTMPEQDCTLVILFGPAPLSETCTVTFQQEEGVSNTQTVQAGQVLSRPEDPVRLGYTFLGWYTQKGELFDFDMAITVDMTLYARWRDSSAITVYFHGNGGEPVLQTIDAKLGQPLSPQAPQRETLLVDGVEFTAYVFTGWRTENGSAWNGTVSTDDSELHLYAQWDTIDRLLAAEENPIAFTTVDQLAQLAVQVMAGESYAGCRFLLTKDITLDAGWRIPIGIYDATNAQNCRPFSGEFYSMQGVTVTLADTLYVPLFGYLGIDAYIHDFTVTGSATQMQTDSGALAQWNNGRISSVTLTDLTIGGITTERIGGISGWNLNDGIIESCVLMNTTVRGRAAGGIASTNGGTIRTCRVGGVGDTSSVEGAGILDMIGSNYNANSNCSELGIGGIVGVNCSGTIEACESYASITVDTSQYIIAGGITGIWRQRNSSKHPKEAVLSTSRESGIFSCTNYGKIHVSAQYPVAGGVIGMVSSYGLDIQEAGFNSLHNRGDISAVNIINDPYAIDICAIGGVVGKIRNLHKNYDTFVIEGLTQDGTISGNNLGQIGGILGGSYANTITLYNCVSRGMVKTEDTLHIGGVFGRIEFYVSDPDNMFYGGGGDEVILDRCASFMDVRATGISVRTGGVAASDVSNKLRPVTIRDCLYFGITEIEQGFWDGICPGRSSVVRSWFTGENAVWVNLNSSDGESGIKCLPYEAMSTGEVAWLLDGGEDVHLSIWTQGDEYPIWGTPSIYRIEVSGSENGYADIAGAQTVYLPQGVRVPVSVTPSGEIKEEEGIRYFYELLSLNAVWVDEEGNIRNEDISQTMLLTVPAANISLQPKFTMAQEELPPAPDNNSDGKGNGKGKGDGKDNSESGSSGHGDTGAGEAGGKMSSDEEIPMSDGTSNSDDPDMIYNDSGEAISEQSDISASVSSVQIDEKDAPTDGGGALSDDTDAELQDTVNTPGHILEVLPAQIRPTHIMGILVTLVFVIIVGAILYLRKWKKV